jgi:hypothetical protein
MRDAGDDEESEGEAPDTADSTRDWAREWSALKEGRAVDWLAAVRWCYRHEPWKIEPFIAMRARERPDDRVIREAIARALETLARDPDREG